MKKKELIFIAGILILAGVLWLGFRLRGNVPIIRSVLPLTERIRNLFAFPGPDHPHRRHQCLRDQRWKVTMIEATCPDHYCMKQKAVDEHGGSIICLPNKVVIEGENTAEDSDSDSSPKIDAVT